MGSLVEESGLLWAPARAASLVPTRADPGASLVFDPHNLCTSLLETVRAYLHMGARAAPTQPLGADDASKAAAVAFSHRWLGLLPHTCCCLVLQLPWSNPGANLLPPPLTPQFTSFLVESSGSLSRLLGCHQKLGGGGWRSGQSLAFSGLHVPCRCPVGLHHSALKPLPMVQFRPWDPRALYRG